MVWRTNIYNDSRPENVRSTIGWVCFVLLFGFVAFNSIWPNNDVNIAADILIFVFGLHVVWKYARVSLSAILSGSGESPDYLIVGITLSWVGQSFRAVGSIVSRLSGFDPVWLNSEFFGWIKLITIIAAICHVVPAGAIKENVPAASRFGVAGAFIVSVVLTVAVLAYKPDPKPWIDNMPGWARDMFHTGAFKPRSPEGRRSMEATADPPD